MRKIGAFEAKTHFSRLLREVEETHESILIQRRGKDVAVLKPCAAEEAEDRDRLAEEIVADFRQFREEQVRRGFGPVESIEELIEDGRER